MLPYSPRHLPKASPVPAKIAGFSSGKITFQKIVDFFAPSTPAASLQELSIFSRTGCTLLTTNGIPTKIMATVMPILVYAILIPNLAKKLPTMPESDVKDVSAIPATAVGSAKGSSIIPSMIRLPGNSYLTNTHARMVPIMPLITDAAKADMKLV